MGIAFTPQLQKRDYYLRLYQKAMKENASKQQFDFSAPPKNQAHFLARVGENYNQFQQAPQQLQQSNQYQTLISKENLYYYKQYIENQQQIDPINNHDLYQGGIENINPMISPEKNLVQKLTSSLKKSLQKLATPSKKNSQDIDEKEFYRQLSEQRDFNNRQSQSIQQDLQESASIFSSVKNSIKKSLNQLAGLSQQQEEQEMTFLQQDSQGDITFSQQQKKNSQSLTSSQKSDQKSKPQSATKILYNNDAATTDIQSNGLNEHEDLKKNSISGSIVKFFMGESEINQKQDDIQSCNSNNINNLILQEQYQKQETLQDNSYPRFSNIIPENNQFTEDLNDLANNNFNNFSECQTKYFNNNLDNQAANQTYNNTHIKKERSSRKQQKNKKNKLIKYALIGIIGLVLFHFCFTEKLITYQTNKMKNENIQNYKPKYQGFYEEYNGLAEEEFKSILQQLKNLNSLDIVQIQNYLNKMYKQQTASILFNQIDQMRLESACIKVNGNKWEYVQ